MLVLTPSTSFSKNGLFVVHTPIITKVTVKELGTVHCYQFGSQASPLKKAGGSEELGM